MKEGKTSYALVILDRWEGGKIAWDPRHMIDEGMASQAGYTLYTQAESPEELEEAIQEYERGEIIVVRPSGELEQEFSRFIGVLLDPPERYHNWALLVDEAATLQSAHTISPDLDRIIRQHPRSALIVQTTHSLQDWHRASRDLTDSLVAFRLKGNSLEAFLDYCDGSEEMREAIADLPRHYAIAVSMGAAVDENEFEYIEPRTWWGAAAAQSRDVSDPEIPEEGEQDGTDSREAFEGDREAERPVGREAEEVSGEPAD